MSSEYYIVEMDEKVFLVDSETRKILGKLDLDTPNPETAKLLEKVFSKGNKVLIVESGNYTVGDFKEFFNFYTRSIGYNLKADWENIKVVKTPLHLKELQKNEKAREKAIGYIVETLNIAGYMNLVQPIRYGKLERVSNIKEKEVEREQKKLSETEKDKKKVSNL